MVFVSLTEAGRKILAVLDRPLAALHDKLLGNLKLAEVKQLNLLLDKVRESMPAEL